MFVVMLSQMQAVCDLCDHSAKLEDETLVTHANAMSMGSINNINYCTVWLKPQIFSEKPYVFS